MTSRFEILKVGILGRYHSILKVTSLLMITILFYRYYLLSNKIYLIGEKIAILYLLYFTNNFYHKITPEYFIFSPCLQFD